MDKSQMHENISMGREFVDYDPLRKLKDLIARVGWSGRVGFFIPLDEDLRVNLHRCVAFNEGREFNVKANKLAPVNDRVLRVSWVKLTEDFAQSQAEWIHEPLWISINGLVNPGNLRVYTAGSVHLVKHFGCNVEYDISKNDVYIAPFIRPEPPTETNSEE